MKKMSGTTENYKAFSFKSPRDWNNWLSKNHSDFDGIWMRLYKKDSGVKSVTHDEALEEALCYGWIDGQLKKHDKKSWLQKFTPRRARSIWSKRNIKHAEELMKAGKMMLPGLKEIEEAKKDGRWENAYDSPAKMTVPDDFLEKLKKNKSAMKFFESLNKPNKYAIAWRLQTAKKPETRDKRMNKILEMLSDGEKFH
jgi:uncharacterized protein YdeI (YjbR/CyaY-like superfamily)